MSLSRWGRFEGRSKREVEQWKGELTARTEAEQHNDIVRVEASMKTLWRPSLNKEVDRAEGRFDFPRSVAIDNMKRGSWLTLCGTQRKQSWGNIQGADYLRRKSNQRGMILGASHLCTTTFSTIISVTSLLVGPSKCMSALTIALHVLWQPTNPSHLFQTSTLANLPFCLLSWSVIYYCIPSILEQSFQNMDQITVLPYWYASNGIIL